MDASFKVLPALFSATFSGEGDVAAGKNRDGDPFHVVHPAAEKLTTARQRAQQQISSHRSRSGGPLYGIRRVPLTREELLTDRLKQRFTAAFANQAHIGLEVTRDAHQDLVAAYGNPDRLARKITMFTIILKRIKSGVPKALPELAQLARSLWGRRKEILAYFDAGADQGLDDRAFTRHRPRVFGACRTAYCGR